MWIRNSTESMCEFQVGIELVYFKPNRVRKRHFIRPNSERSYYLFIYSIYCVLHNDIVDNVVAARSLGRKFTAVGGTRVDESDGLTDGLTDGLWRTF